MDMETWLDMGIRQGWISKTWCYVHGNPELSDEEQVYIDEEGGDLDSLCITVMRVI